MINLLPPEQKEELRKTEKLKTIFILGLVFLSTLISQILLLFLIKIYLIADWEIQKIYSQERAEELEIPAIKELEDKINLSGRVFAKLDSFYKSQIDAAAVLEKISGILPDGLYLTSLSFNPSSRQISLTGFSQSREKLLSLRENLEKEEAFSEAYFPPENWVNPADISFNVIFKLK